MTVLIIEDEAAAARALQRLLAEIRPDSRVLALLESAADSVTWLAENDSPDLIFMNVHLADGSCFDIFRRINVSSPVIFTTAYDEHVQKIFQAYSIDYLLKPVLRKNLQRSLERFRPTGHPVSATTPLNVAQLLCHLLPLSGGLTPYKTNWLVPRLTKLVPLSVNEVAYFISRDKRVVLTTLAGQEYLLDQSLDELETQVNPQHFFRATPQVLLARPSLVQLKSCYKGQLLVQLRPPTSEEVIVRKSRAPALRQWSSVTSRSLLPKGPSL